MLWHALNIERVVSRAMRVPSNDRKGKSIQLKRVFSFVSTILLRWHFSDVQSRINIEKKSGEIYFQIEEVVAETRDMANGLKRPEIDLFHSEGDLEFA